MNQETREKIEDILARINRIEDDLGYLLEADLPPAIKKSVVEALERLAKVWDAFFEVVEEALEGE